MAGVFIHFILVQILPPKRDYEVVSYFKVYFFPFPVNRCTYLLHRACFEPQTLLFTYHILILVLPATKY